MNIKVKFLGAAGEVTGSKYLLRIDDFILLVDCGLFQGSKRLKDLNWDDFPIDPGTINAIVLTHAHLDHTGYLPRLIKQGFKGPIYCTSATADLMHLILMDSAKIQEEDARYAKLKGFTRNEEDDGEPLYTLEDVLPITEMLRTSIFETPVSVTENISVQFYNAGHILGAAIVELTIKGDHQTKKIVFSGDLGRYQDPILFPPHTVEEADILFVESTYGSRAIVQTPREEIIDMMNMVFENDGNLIVPAFSIGRTQTLLMYIKNVLMSKEIPEIKIAVDSPMAIAATEFYRKHQAYHKLRGIDLDEDESFITLRRNLVIARTPEESRRINEISHDSIIIASSGMMTGGRILHHLANRLPDPKNVVMISGYQAEGSRGWQLQNGEKSIRIFGRDVEVKAKIFSILGLSAHADRNELLQWLSGFKNPPAHTFIVHGDLENAHALGDTLKSKGWKATVPVYLENVELFKNI